MLKQLEKEKSWKVGLCQALLVAVYCGSVATFFSFMARTADPPMPFFGFFLMLLLLVFSAAITGSLVFGYPVYLAVINRKIKEAAEILAYTLAFSLLIIIVTIIYLVSIL